MTCLTASDLSLLETIEQRLQTDVSVTLLAELERELFRLRCDFNGEEWEHFCTEFPKRSVFGVLQQGTLTLRRLTDCFKGSRLAFPANVLDTVLADSFQARPTVAHSPVHVINAWEYSLPASRSIRSRKAYFSREISEVLRTAVKPRILILGAGQMREAGDALSAAHAQHVEFVALEPDQAVRESLRRRYVQQRIEIRECDWNKPEYLADSSETFDLIYSTACLDSLDDRQVISWLSAGAEKLRPGGRILAANFTPGSRDAGWMEACWNWHPFYRCEEHLAQLVMDLKHPEVRGHAILRDESGASAYLEIHSL